MNKLQKLTGIAALVASLTGCNPEKDTLQETNYSRPCSGIMEMDIIGGPEQDAFIFYDAGNGITQRAYIKIDDKPVKEYIRGLNRNDRPWEKTKERNIKR